MAKFFQAWCLLIFIITQIACISYHRPQHKYYDQYLTIGRNEWAELPELGIGRLELKADTGAQTSALHAFDIEEFTSKGERYIKFKTLPQRKSHLVKECKAKLLTMRKVKGTCGEALLRPVISTTIKIGNVTKEIEITLSDRKNMKYRFLLGRQAMQGNILVDPSSKFMVP